MRVGNYIFALSNLVIFIFSFMVKDPSILVHASLITCILMFLDKLGKGVILRETVALYNSLIYLFVPLMGYKFYTRSNATAAMYLRFMPVSIDEYFSVALPAISGFILFLCWPLGSTHGDVDQSIEEAVRRVKKVLSGNQRIGLWMMAIGTAASFLLPSLPNSLIYIFQLIYLTSFCGLMYLYFSGISKVKNVYLVLFILFIVFTTLNTGMFTIIVYMGMTVFSFFFLGRHTAMWKKLLVFSLGVFVLLILQSVKPEYRKQYELRHSKYIEFAILVQRKLEKADKMLTTEFMWPIYYRVNQGYYVALVQNYIPRVKPFDNGRKLMEVFASAFVPRVLWPDKPKAGGFENMRYYAGFTLRGYTMNVGPLGEAYGSFGRSGAIVYMLVLGALIRLVYRQVFVLSRRIPTLILWIPLLFFEVSYAGENDTLQIVNSLVKATIFVYLLYRIFPRLFIMKPKPN